MLTATLVQILGLIKEAPRLQGLEVMGGDASLIVDLSFNSRDSALDHGQLPKVLFLWNWRWALKNTLDDPFRSALTLSKSSSMGCMRSRPPNAQMDHIGDVGIVALTPSGNPPDVISGQDAKINLVRAYDGSCGGEC